MPKTLDSLRLALRKKSSPRQAEHLKKFFKTAPGQYAAQDIFIGVKVPEIHRLVKDFFPLPMASAEFLIQSKIHEERVLGLFFLVKHFQKGTGPEKKQAYTLYLKNLEHVNNWDLVDLSAPHIVGEYLYARDKTQLDRWSHAPNLWQRRVAIVATLAFIRKNNFSDTLRIADLLLADSEDLIHKAVGWMLREVGKRDLAALEHFLKPRYFKMPRTMLRYAIEKFPASQRKLYLTGKI